LVTLTSRGARNPCLPKTRGIREMEMQPLVVYVRYEGLRKQARVLGTPYFLEAKVLDGVTMTSTTGAHLAFYITDNSYQNKQGC
jgi:hypothetical protein